MLALQNPEFKILADVKLFAFQNPDIKILADCKILAFQILNSRFPPIYGF